MDRQTEVEALSLRLAEFPQVTAIVLGGSEAAGVADSLSDIDLYVYAEAEIPVEARRAIAAEFADRLEIDNRIWEPGDEWIERATGRAIDIMYRTPAWIEDQLARVLARHEASAGYSTCFWWNVLHSRALYDRAGWYATLQQSARRPYPDELRRAIIAKNLPLLCSNISSYRRQIEKALDRGDLVSVNHRIAAFLASYWDILFAWNSVPHPGEKRLPGHARSLCAKLPRDWEPHLKDLLESHAILENLDQLADGIEELTR